MATKKKTKTFTPSSALGEAIVAGDLVAVDAALDAPGPAGWPTLCAEARAALAHVAQREQPGSPTQKRAAERAVIVVGTANEAADVLRHHDGGEAIALLTRFKPAHLPELATALVEDRWPNSDLAQRLIIAGLSTRPTSDAYVLALIGWSQTVWQRRRRGDEAITFAALVRSDPGLFSEGVLLRLFDVEGTREVSLGIHDQYVSNDSWSAVLIGLVNDRLLAATSSSTRRYRPLSATGRSSARAGTSASSARSRSPPTNAALMPTASSACSTAGSHRRSPSPSTSSNSSSSTAPSIPTRCWRRSRR